MVGPENEGANEEAASDGSRLQQKVTAVFFLSIEPSDNDLKNEHFRQSPFPGINTNLSNYLFFSSLGKLELFFIRLCGLTEGLKVRLI